MMNVVGSRFGCLHPLTSLRLYSTICVPLMLYGSELWCPTRSEILMLERVHRKILRTIQGLPVRCHHLALQTLVGQPSILTLIHQRLLSFAQSFSDLPHDPLPSEVLFARLSSSPQKGLLPHLHSVLSELCLPPLTSVLQGTWSRFVWKKQVRSATLSAEFLQFLEVCDHLPLSNCLLSVGKPGTPPVVSLLSPDLTTSGSGF